MTSQALDQFARDHAVLLSICCGLHDEPCGEVYGGMTIDPQFAGLSHGLGPCCLPKLRSARAEWLALKGAA